MRYPLSLNFGITPTVYAIAALLAATEDFDIDEETLRQADVRMTAFYRSGGRGGFLIRARADIFDGLPYVHLAVVEHGSTGAPLVVQWSAPCSLVPPTTEWPKAAVIHDRFREGQVGEVAEFVVACVREHLAGPGRWLASSGGRRGAR